MKLLFPALCVLAATTASVEAADSSTDGGRFRVDAHLQPVAPTSSDGRFAIQASARLGGTDDQRFAVKSLAASCDPSGADDVFANGFEGP